MLTQVFHKSGKNSVQLDDVLLQIGIPVSGLWTDTQTKVLLGSLHAARSSLKCLFINDKTDLF